MNERIEDILEEYLTFQDYIDIPSSIMDDKELMIQMMADRPAKLVYYQQLQVELHTLLPQLDPLYICDIYNRGGRLFRANLCGYMSENFRQEYIDCMKQAIIQGHQYSANIFLQVLANNSATGLTYVIIYSLGNDKLRHTALSVVAQLEITEAKFIVEYLTHSEDAATREIADGVLQALQDNR